jgi:HlyD family secretion protein
MKTRKPFILVVAAAIVIAAGAAAYFWQRGAATATEFQGWIEADQLFVGADEPGRLTSLGVKEGDEVKEGQPLFALQSDIQDAEITQARAALDEAKARLARVQAAQQRPEEVAVLQAQEARFKAALEQSQPEYERAQSLVERGTAPPMRLEQAKAAFERDQALLAEVRRQIAVARLKARNEDIEAAQEVVKQAKARLASAETRRAQRQVSAPADGVVQELYFRIGEVVPAGRPVVALLPPGNLKVRFFVPQADLPQLALGDIISVRCDGCADGLRAEVRFLSRQAEFTPPIIFSREERAKLVFRVEAIPLRPEMLRVGQPVTISLHDGPGSQTAYGRP